MPIACFPTDFVYWESIENHQDFKNDLLPKIKAMQKNMNKSNPWLSSIVQTGFDYDNDIHDKNNIMLSDQTVIDNIIKKPVNNLLKQLSTTFPFKMEKLHIEPGWWNIYDKGNFQEQHNHNNMPTIIDDELYSPVLSAIYILHDDNPSSSVVFTKTACIPFMNLSDDLDFDTRNAKDIKEGTVILFPSGLRHHVRPCAIPERVTISFNVFAILSSNPQFPARQTLN